MAIAIVGAAGLSLMTVLDTATRQQGLQRREERRMREADRILTAESLLTREDLDLQLGNRLVGDFLVSVSRPESGLYRVQVAEKANPGRLLLATVVSRSQDPRP